MLASAGPVGSASEEGVDRGRVALQGGNRGGFEPGERLEFHLPAGRSPDSGDPSFDQDRRSEQAVHGDDRTFLPARDQELAGRPAVEDRIERPEQTGRRGDGGVMRTG